MDDAAQFVQRFTEFWARPRVQDLSTLLTPDVVLIQPLTPRLEGLAAAQADFAKLFNWLPDMHGMIDGWSARDSTLFIEFRLACTLKGQYIEWPAVDRMTLRGDKASERISYFDPLPIVLKLGKTPRAWPSWWRSGVARFW